MVERAQGKDAHRLPRIREAAGARADGAVATAHHDDVGGRGRGLTGGGEQLRAGHLTDVGVHADAREEFADARGLSLDLSRAKAGGRVEEDAGLHADST